MNTNKRDIYFEGRIYQDVADGMSRYNYGSVPIQGEHPFTNMEDVTGRYELDCRQRDDTCTESDCPSMALCKFGKIVAYPAHTSHSPAPVAPLPKGVEGKAKELVEKFARYADCNHYEYLGAGRVEIQTSEEKKIKSAKQCALISINREIDLINRLLATNLNNDFDLLRERGELMEVRTAINQL